MTVGKGYDKLNSYFLGTVTEYIRPYLSEVDC